MNEEELARMEAEVTQRLERHYVRHKGAREPQRIPFAERMRSFLSRAAEGGARDPQGPAGWLAARMTLSDDDRHVLVAVRSKSMSCARSFRGRPIRAWITPACTRTSQRCCRRSR